MVLSDYNPPSSLISLLVGGGVQMRGDSSGIRRIQGADGTYGLSSLIGKGKAQKLYPAGRECEDCGKVLARHNKGPCCYTCQGARDRKAALFAPRNSKRAANL